MKSVVYHGTAPTYITELCRRCHDRRLRSTAREDYLCIYVVPTTCHWFADSRWTKSLEFTATECSKRWIKAHFQTPPKDFTFYSVFWVDYLDSYEFKARNAFYFICYCVYFILSRLIVLLFRFVVCVYCMLIVRRCWASLSGA